MIAEYPWMELGKSLNERDVTLCGSTQSSAVEICVWRRNKTKNKEEEEIEKTQSELKRALVACL